MSDPNQGPPWLAHPPSPPLFAAYLPDSASHLHYHPWSHTPNQAVYGAPSRPHDSFDVPISIKQEIKQDPIPWCPPATDWQNPLGERYSLPANPLAYTHHHTTTSYDSPPQDHAPSAYVKLEDPHFPQLAFQSTSFGPDESRSSQDPYPPEYSQPYVGVQYSAGHPYGLLSPGAPSAYTSSMDDHHSYEPVQAMNEASSPGVHSVQPQRPPLTQYRSYTLAAAITPISPPSSQSPSSTTSTNSTSSRAPTTHLPPPADGQHPPPHPHHHHPRPGQPHESRQRGRPRKHSHPLPRRPSPPPPPVNYPYPRFDAVPSPPDPPPVMSPPLHRVGPSPHAAPLAGRPVMGCLEPPRVPSPPPPPPLPLPDYAGPAAPRAQAPPLQMSLDEVPFPDHEDRPGQAMFKLNTPGVPKEQAKKKPIMACLFCRERKIACGPPAPGSVEGRCNQCARRGLVCEYPKESRRGQHKRGPRVARLKTGLAEGQAEDAAPPSAVSHSPSDVGAEPSVVHGSPAADGCVQKRRAGRDAAREP